MYKKIINKIKSYIYSKRYKAKIKIKGKIWIKKDKQAKIVTNGTLTLGENSFNDNGRNLLLRMDKNSTLKINGNAQLFYGCDVILFENAKLEIGNSFINSDAKIRCHKNISIGNGCAISHDFTIMDSNAHYLNGDKKEKEIIIEDNVWIGTRVTIMSGVTIGKGAVIASGAVVTKDVPPKTLVAGVPATVIKTDIEWKL